MSVPYTPDPLRGRIASIFRMAIFGAAPLGALAGGFLAAAAGLWLPLAIAGCLQLAIAAATAGPLGRRVRDGVRPAASVQPEASRIAAPRDRDGVAAQTKC